MSWLLFKKNEKTPRGHALQKGEQMPDVSDSSNNMPFLTQFSNRFSLAMNVSKSCAITLLGFYFLLNLTVIAQLNDGGQG